MEGNPQDFEMDVPPHLEAFYRLRLGEYVFVTPGVISWNINLKALIYR
jgi:hypothetical protein